MSTVITGTQDNVSKWLSLGVMSRNKIERAVENNIIINPLTVRSQIAASSTVHTHAP